MPKRAPLTSTTVPPISGTFEYAVRAMLRDDTHWPPALLGS